ncbi:hypothetical protein [Rhodococcus sp. IEGM 1318]|uniref:hypothetical protein n=1 Tax=Rhodococcus sp. IEGM 1318 TaxID=3082226 RepID=UPI0029532D91|nr:hypothetical protein [Rhodococcus sp. IEGM 1318]MDV8009301.1 hypothetical protein [Rhodococcus sp. IEGM 1318]
MDAEKFDVVEAGVLTASAEQWEPARSRFTVLNELMNRSAIGTSAVEDATVHLSGNASVHQLPDKQVKSAMSVYAEAALVGEPLDSSYHQRGIDARKNAHTTLTEALSILDDVEDRADRLLADLLGLVGTEPTVD